MKQKKYVVTITEYLVKAVIVSASDENEAYEKAEELINNETIVLDDGDFTDRDIEVTCEYRTKDGYDKIAEEY